MRARSQLALVIAALVSCTTPEHTTGATTTAEEHANSQSEEYEFNATRDPSQPDGIFLPATLDEALNELDRGLSIGFKRLFREAHEDPVGHFHGDLGMWMRTRWGLWAGSSLSQHFNELGILHPDDMSGIILTSYWRRARGVVIDLDSQVAACKAYWAEVETSR